MDFDWLRSFFAPLAVAAVVGLGGAYLTAQATLVAFEERIAALEEERATRSQLNAAEERARAYTDSKFSELMIMLTEIQGSTNAMRDDVREIKQDIRDIEAKGSKE